MKFVKVITKIFEIKYIFEISIYMYYFNIIRDKYDKEREVCKVVYRYDECIVMRGVVFNIDIYNV